MTDGTTVPHRYSTVPLRRMQVEVREGPDAGRTLIAESDTITVGSAPGNNLQLSDDTVSRYHLELSAKDDGILIVDLGSTNGTLLSSARIERAVVPPGTVLSLGRSAIRVAEGERSELEIHDDDRLGSVRGRSSTMRALMAKIQRAAQVDASVLLLGETGTGKEVIARAIHEASPRAARPFETVDCGALLPTLVASELFGHEKGAFTGAERQHAGAFERADGGTIFLDEIGELPANLQTALLGALERRSFRRVGGTKPLEVDVRVICATHRDLRAEVNAGTFRQDLYYRIAVILLSIPPLRERTGDIPLLVEHFLREAGHSGPIEEVIPPSVLASLKAHRWPGNVRELRNFVESCLAMGEAPALDGLGGARAGGGEAVEETNDPDRFPSISLDELVRRPYRTARSLVLNEFESLYLKRLMERAKGNVSRAARESELNRSYLTQMLKRIHQPGDETEE